MEQVFRATHIIPVNEEPFVKVQRRTQSRLNFNNKNTSRPTSAKDGKSGDSISTRSWGSYQEETPISNIEELSQIRRINTKNVYTEFKPLNTVNKQSPDSYSLLKRPGTYKHFWMNDAKDDEAKSAVAQKKLELERMMVELEEVIKKVESPTKTKTVNNTKNMRLVSNGSSHWNQRVYLNETEPHIGNIHHNITPNRVANLDRDIITVSGLHNNTTRFEEERCRKEVAHKDDRESVLFGNVTQFGDHIGRMNAMAKLFTTGYKNLSKVSPMYAKGSEVPNKFRDVVVSNKVVTGTNGLAKIFREDGQRVYRLGERGAGYGARENVQDFTRLRAQCLEEGRLFEDPDFLPVDASLFFSQRPDRRFQWLRPSEIADDPQLFVEGFSRFDVQQGELGDCWLLAAVANLTLHRKLFFQIVPDDQSFDEEYAGIFHFRFWQYGKWVDVVVDDRLPTHHGKLVFLHSSEKNEFWSALLEKAYAKLHGSYEALKGGSTCEAMEDFTGGVTEMYEMSEVPPNLFTILQHGYQRSSLMGCSIEPDPNVLEAETSQGLIRGHAYSITRVCYVDIATPGRQGKIPLLRLRNPWGNEAEWNGPWSDKSPEWRYISEDDKQEIGLTFDDDGEFWMSYRDFVNYFTRIEICNLNPDSLDPNEAPEGCNKKWDMRIFEGEWVRGVTAGGCRNYLDSFWQNPQYILTLTDPDEDDDQNLCTVIVALMQKNRRSQRSAGLDCLTVGFALYKQPHSGHKPLPLDFFKYNASVARSPSFINLREVSCRFKLPPGQYCIVPSTFEPNDEGEFLLRVFTEKSCSLDENDEDIGMGEVDDRVKDVVPDIPSTPEDPVRQFFNKLAGDDGEVDWLELKEILDYAMRNELGPNGPSGVGGGTAAPLQSGQEQQEKGCLEQLLCSFFGPICKEFGIDVEQMAGQQQSGPESVHLTQPETRGQGFSKDVCRSMVAMLDNDGSGKLGFEEFKSLWVDIRQWKAVFKLYDPNGTGKIPAYSLRDALHSAGYTLNNHILNILAHRYGSRDGYIAFDDFIMCAVRLKTMIAKNEPLENIEREMPLWDS